jgi:hypothetical protein
MKKRAYRHQLQNRRKTRDSNIEGTVCRERQFQGPQGIPYQVILPFFSRQNCEKERKIGVVVLKQKQPPRHNREIGVELVVAF